MFFERGTHEIRIGMTVVELQQMQAHEERLYATPTLGGEANHVYAAHAPMYRADFVFATVDDFLEAEGWTDLGDPDASILDHEITIILPRTRRPSEA